LLGNGKKGMLDRIDWAEVKAKQKRGKKIRGGTFGREEMSGKNHNTHGVALRRRGGPSRLVVVGNNCHEKR